MKGGKRRGVEGGHSGDFGVKSQNTREREECEAESERGNGEWHGERGRERGIKENERK